MIKEKYPYPDVFFCPMGNDERITDTVDISYKPEVYMMAKKYFSEKDNEFTNFFKKNDKNKVLLDKVSFWGTTVAMKNVWENMKTDDLIFFSKNNQGFVYMARIQGIYKGELSQEINKQFWSNNSSEKKLIWEYIFILKDVRRINISSADLNIFPGYSKNFIHRGLMKMNRYWGLEFWESFPIYFMRNPKKFKELGDE